MSLLNPTSLNLAVLIACFLAPVISQAQDENAAANSDDNLQTMVQKWELLDSQIADKEVEFRAANDPEAAEALRKQYSSLVEQSVEMVDKIRAKAVESLNAGDIDETTSRILIGLVMNDAEFDRNNEASQLADKMIAAGVDGSLFEKAAKADRLSVFSKELLEEMFLRSNQKKQDDLPQVMVSTSKGDLVLELFENEAPNSVANFVSLVEKEFYNDLKFHRVVEGFVAQAGDPNGDGSGGPGYTIKCECDSPEARRHFYGSLSMAHAGKDSGGSQFFLCLNRTSHLDGRHTVFGRVISGIEVLEKLSRNMTTSGKIANAETDTIKSMKVVRKRDHEYMPEKMGDEEEAETPEQPPAQPETQKEPAAEKSADEDGASKSDEPAETATESGEDDG